MCTAPVEHEVLVHLVGDHDEVVLDRDVGDHGQLVGIEDLAGRVVRRVEHDQLRARRHGAAQRVGIEAEAPGAVGREEHGRRTRTSQGDERQVAVVHRLEHDDVVAWGEHAEQGAGDRLGGTGGDEHLGVGIDAQPVEAVPGARRSPRGARATRARAGTGCSRSGWRPRRRSRTSSGPSVSGNPCPRLIEPVAVASADISAKIVVPNGASFGVRGSDRVIGDIVGTAPRSRAAALAYPRVVAVSGAVGSPASTPAGAGGGPNVRPGSPLPSRPSS